MNPLVVASIVLVIAGISMIALRTRRGKPIRTKITKCVLTAFATLVASAVTPTAAGTPEPVQTKRFTAAFATPISFFGRVVDQNGSPIPSANIKMWANNKAMGGKPSEYTLQSDANGLFAINGITGLSLAVEVSKAGYKIIPPQDGKVTSSGVFNYGLSSIGGPHHPRKAAPVVFTLRKPGPVEPLYKVGEKNFRVPRDGTPVVIPVDPEGQHRVVVRCWNTDLHRPVDQRQYDWRFEISVVNGALCPRANLDEEAPLSEYIPKDLIEMPASLPANKWSGFVERSYFLKFEDETFARVKLEMHAAGDHFVAWESFFNPKPGSRNLESP